MVGPNRTFEVDKQLTACSEICAGKQSVAEYLTEKHGFVDLHIARTGSLPAAHNIASQDHVSQLHQGNSDTKTSFVDVESLLEFVTERWRERWVTTDIWDETMLTILLRRPSFILISVEAPISLRWQRFKQR